MEPQFKIRDRVKHVVDESKQGIVTGILLRETSVSYAVTWGSDLNDKYHYGFELAPVNPPGHLGFPAK